MILNKKGYITIEVIVGATLTAVIAFFLVELTMKLVNKTDDYYEDTLAVTDKALAIKNIKQAIESDITSYGIIDTVSCSNNICNIAYSDGTRKQLKLNANDKIIEYGDYTKKFNSVIDNLNLSFKKNGDFINFKISGSNIFSSSDYSFNILIFNYDK